MTPQTLFQICAICLVLATLGCKDQKGNEWLVVTKDTLLVGTEFTGELAARSFTDIGPPSSDYSWSFTLAKVGADGELVSKGDLVFALDPSKLRERLSATENRRDTTDVTLKKRRFEMSLARQDAKLALDEAESEVRRAAVTSEASSEFTASIPLKVGKINLASKEATVAYLRSKMRISNAISKGEIAQLVATANKAKRAVDAINEEIANMQVTAPHDGTLIVRSSRSEKYKVGDSVYQYNKVVDIASLDSMMAKGIVDEADFSRLKLGQEIHLRLEAHPDTEIKGELTKIANNVQRKSSDIPTKVFSIEVSIKTIEGLKLRPGMRFRGEVITDKADDATIVPLASVFTSKSGPVAYVKRAGKIVQVPLKLGRSGKRGIEVLEGLQEGDKVSRHDLGKRQP